MSNRGIAPAKQLELPFARRGEATIGPPGEEAPVRDGGLMERVVERSNLPAALRRVQRNGGSPGIDCMTVEALPDYLRREWPKIREQLLSGTYRPHPVRRVKIPKPGGGVRKLGIPTVLDRFIVRLRLTKSSRPCSSCCSGTGIRRSPSKVTAFVRGVRPTKR